MIKIHNCASIQFSCSTNIYVVKCEQKKQLNYQCKSLFYVYICNCLSVPYRCNNLDVFLSSGSSRPYNASVALHADWPWCVLLSIMNVFLLFLSPHPILLPHLHPFPSSLLPLHYFNIFCSYQQNTSLISEMFVSSQYLRII